MVQWNPIWTVLNRNATLATYDIVGSNDFLNTLVAGLQLFGHMNYRRVQDVIAGVNPASRFSEKVQRPLFLPLDDDLSAAEVYSEISKVRNSDGFVLLAPKNYFLAIEVESRSLPALQPPERFFYTFDTLEQLRDAKYALEMAIELLKQHDQCYGSILYIQDQRGLDVDLRP